MVYTLAYRCFLICSNWTQFHTELTFLKKIFLKNGCPENFIDKSFKKFLDNIRLVKENVPTMEKKSLHLVFPYLEVVSWQTRTKLQQALMCVLNCNSFRNKNPIPEDLISGIVYKFETLVKISGT